MPNLKVATANIMLLCALSGCSTLLKNSSFEIKNETDLLTELLVSPDRVAVHCEELDEEPDVGAYGFMIHLLNKKRPSQHRRSVSGPIERTAKESAKESCVF